MEGGGRRPRRDSALRASPRRAGQAANGCSSRAARRDGRDGGREGGGHGGRGARRPRWRASTRPASPPTSMRWIRRSTLFRKILDVNVVGTFIVARAAARLMKDTRRRRHRQHRLGVGPARQQGAQRLRRVEGRRVRADAGAGQRPGALWHPRQRRGAGPGRHADGAGACTSAQDRALWMRHLPMRRYGEPDEIASVIEFLLDGTQVQLCDRRDRGRRRRLPRRRHHRGGLRWFCTRIEARRSRR